MMMRIVAENASIDAETPLIAARPGSPAGRSPSTRPSAGSGLTDVMAQ
jgi:hypothetical protein